MDKDKNIGCLVLVIFIIGFWFGGNHAKYEGHNAEYWFNYYDSQDGINEELTSKYNDFRSCVEDYDSLNWQEKIKIGGIFYYCE